MSGFFSGFKNIKNISIGLIYVLFTLWLIFHTSQYVPNDKVDTWNKIFIGYGLLNAMIFGVADIRNKLFDVKFVKFIGRFFVFFIIGLSFFYLLMSRIDPTSSDILLVLSGVPLWLMLLHGLVFATTESAIWQGYLDKKIGQPWSALVGGLFHWGIWSGGAIFVIITSTLLFMFFSWIHWRFRKDSRDLAPVIGVHTAYNLIKLGLLVSVGVGF